MKETERVNNYLKALFEKPKIELNYSTPFELLVAVILSAQCTDKRVNEVTKTLFKRFNTPTDFANLEQEKLEKLIFSCGFYRNKAKSIIGASKSIIKDFNNQVPSNLKDLQSLDGVGRKTANVVYSVAFGGDAIAVDTHVFRVANRIGIVKAKNVLECELQLMKLFDRNEWSALHFRLVLFGRYVCKAKKPNCEICELKDICKFYNKGN